MAEESVLDGLPSRRVPFWKRATPQTRRALEAEDFRRTAEANRFVADNDPAATGSFGDIVAGKGGEKRPPFQP